MSDDEPAIADGHLTAARSAGAHDEFLAFVAEYPESGVAETLRTAISMDALDHFEGFGGSFEAALFEHGASHASNADPENERRMRALFNNEQLPAWMREDEDEEAVTDGGEPEGAIDNSFDDAERDAYETLSENGSEYQREIKAGDVAIDLVTRQPLYVTSVAASSLTEYYDREGFDLFNYKSHPYLPVQINDRVLNCVFVPRSVEGVHNVGKEYAYPEGRLAKVPIEEAVKSGESE